MRLAMHPRCDRVPPRWSLLNYSRTLFCHIVHVHIDAGPPEAKWPTDVRDRVVFELARGRRLDGKHGQVVNQPRQLCKQMAARSRSKVLKDEEVMRYRENDVKN